MTLNAETDILNDNISESEKLLIDELSTIKNEDDIINIIWAAQIDEFSVEFQNKIFDRVIKNHIIHRDDFIKANYIFCSDNIYDTETDYIFDYFLQFPKIYRDKFQSADQELFHSIINKKSIKSEFQGKDTPNKETSHPLSFIQNYYLRVSRTENIENATELFNNFREEILNPANEFIIGVATKTDIFEYFLKTASSKEESIWDFMAPLAPLFDTLTERQKNIFTAVGISEFFNDYVDNYNFSLNNKSEQYKNIDVLNTLKIVPYHILKNYINHKEIKSEWKQDLQNLLLSNKMQEELAPKKGSNKRKI